jgi:hypothetical protein
MTWDALWGEMTEVPLVEWKGRSLDFGKDLLRERRREVKRGRRLGRLMEGKREMKLATRWGRKKVKQWELTLVKMTEIKMAADWEPRLG